MRSTATNLRETPAATPKALKMELKGKILLECPAASRIETSEKILTEYLVELDSKKSPRSVTDNDVIDAILIQTNVRTSRSMALVFEVLGKTTSDLIRDYIGTRTRIESDSAPI